MFNTIRKVQECVKSAMEISITKEQLTKRLKESNLKKTPIEIYNIIPQSSSEQAYYILDSNCNFAGQIFLKKSTWSYISGTVPISIWNTKVLAVHNVLMLQSLAELAGFDNLNWIIVYGSEKDLIEIIYPETSKSEYILTQIAVVNEKLKTNEQYKEILWQFGKL
jgi:hypothetical protein